jgi:hypothetical protein
MLRHYQSDNFMCKINTIQCKPLKHKSTNGTIREIYRTGYYVAEEDKLAEHRNRMWQYSDFSVQRSRGLDGAGV